MLHGEICFIDPASLPLLWAGNPPFIRRIKHPIHGNEDVDEGQRVIGVSEQSKDGSRKFKKIVRKFKKTARLEGRHQSRHGRLDRHGNRGNGSKNVSVKVPNLVRVVKHACEVCRWDDCRRREVSIQVEEVCSRGDRRKRDVGENFISAVVLQGRFVILD